MRQVKSGLDFERILKTITYKPNVRFELCGHNFVYRDMKTIDLMITYKTEDVHTGVPIEIIHRNQMMDELFDTKERFIGWVMECVHRAERHEAEEFFKVKGVCLNDPHKDDKN